MSIFLSESGMPRLIRFVPASDMPTPDTLTIFNPQHNLVVINKELFEELDWYGKHRAVRATTTLVLD